MTGFLGTGGPIRRGGAPGAPGNLGTPPGGGGGGGGIPPGGGGGGGMPPPGGGGGGGYIGVELAGILHSLGTDVTHVVRNDILNFLDT